MDPPPEEPPLEEPLPEEPLPEELLPEELLPEELLPEELLPEELLPEELLPEELLPEELLPEELLPEELLPDELLPEELLLEEPLLEELPLEEPPLEEPPLAATLSDVLLPLTDTPLAKASPMSAIVPSLRHSGGTCVDSPATSWHSQFRLEPPLTAVLGTSCTTGSVDAPVLRVCITIDPFSAICRLSQLRVCEN